MNAEITIEPLLPASPASQKLQAAEILVAAFRVHWPEAWDNLFDAVEEVAEMLADKERFVLIAVDRDENVLGWIGGIPSYDGRVWELHPLAVHPDHQRRGIGRALVTAFEEEVRARGGLTVHLGTDDEDGSTSLADTDLYEDTHRKMAELKNYSDHPVTFYQKMGYILIGVMPDANGIGKPDLYMGKRVGPPDDESSL